MYQYNDVVLLSKTNRFGISTAVLGVKRDHGDVTRRERHGDVSPNASAPSSYS